MHINDQHVSLHLSLYIVIALQATSLERGSWSGKQTLSDNSVPTFTNLSGSLILLEHIHGEGTNVSEESLLQLPQLSHITHLSPPLDSIMSRDPVSYSMENVGA
jgi:hypothetical protein